MKSEINRNKTRRKTGSLTAKYIKIIFNVYFNSNPSYFIRIWMLYFQKTFFNCHLSGLSTLC